MQQRFVTAALGALILLILGSGAFAQDKTIKIGNLTDMSSVFSDLGGVGSTIAARMAVEDAGLAAKGWTVDVLQADHQNKPDVGASISRRWFDVDKVDVVVDGENSGVALAVNQVVKEKNTIMINSGAGTVELTNSQCTPNTVHWTYDTYMLAHGTAQALGKAGRDSWFFLTADYAFGAAMERDASRVVLANGGKVLGSVRVPTNSSDFSSFLLQAQASKAKVIGLAMAGADTTNAIKQAAEFGVAKGGQKLAPLIMFITDVHSLGLDTAQGLTFSGAFYWDQNEQTRLFARRFQERMKNHSMPTSIHAGVYAGLLHYFKALEALGANPHDGVKVVAKMKEMSTDDPLFGKGRIEPNGRVIHPAYLYEVKTPAESRQPWDYLKIVAIIPAEEAFLPLSQSTCSLLIKRT